MPADRRRAPSLLVTAALLLVSTVLYRPSPASAAHPSSRFERAAAAAVLRVLNRERAQHHLPPLATSPQLCRSARRHDVAMARADRMAHQLPGEPPFTARIARAGYDWRRAAENIGWNSALTRAGAVQLERLMYREKPPNDEHRRNILDPRLHDVGVEVLVDPVHHKLWLTTDFGSLR